MLLSGGNQEPSRSIAFLEALGRIKSVPKGHPLGVLAGAVCFFLVLVSRFCDSFKSKHFCFFPKKFFFSWETNSKKIWSAIFASWTSD